MISPSLFHSPFTKLRLVFMGTPQFALPSLQALHEAGHDIVALYTQPPRPAGRGQKETPSPIHLYANEKGFPVFTPVSLKSPEVQAEFACHKADAAIVAAYGLLLPKPILDAYPLGCINIHPSLLPRWRGAAPIQRTIMAGDTETGICIMQMDQGLDTGDILSMMPFSIPDIMDAGGLHDTLSMEAAPLLLDTLDQLHQRKLAPVKQSAQGITYANKITKEDTRIDWARPAAEIRNLIRGLSPSPGATFSYQDEIIKLYAAALLPRAEQGYAPGTVLSLDPLAIACGSGVLLPQTLQRAGKKRLPVSEWINGIQLSVGAVFT